MWPFGDLWGGREKRKKVRTYLRIVWEEKNDYRRMDATYDDVEREKNLILNVSCRT